MVDKSSQISALRRVNNTIQIDTKQVRGPNSNRFVLRLSQIGQHRPNNLYEGGNCPMIKYMEMITLMRSSHKPAQRIQ